jgi:NitT/TauT family transport system permease protein
MSIETVPPEEQVSARAAAEPAPRGDPNAWRYRLGSVLLALVVIGLWELLPRLGLVNAIILPAFTDVAAAFWSLINTEFFLGHFFTTLREILLGFVLGTMIGLVSGTLLAVWTPVKRVIYPFVVGFQAVPKIVFAPLFVAWFGYGESSKVVMAIAISFFPVLINTLVGLESVPHDAVRLMRSLRATSTQTFWKISLPHALPIIFAGVKAALTFAVVGAIVGEFVGASEGLGYLLNLYNFQLRIDRVFAVIVVLSALGALGYFLLEWVDRKLIYWREDDK